MYIAGGFGFSFDSLTSSLQARSLGLEIGEVS